MSYSDVNTAAGSWKTLTLRPSEEVSCSAGAGVGAGGGCTGTGADTGAACAIRSDAGAEECGWDEDAQRSSSSRRSSFWTCLSFWTLDLLMLTLTFRSLLEYFSQMY